MQESIVFLVRVQCRCKESSRSLSHLLMSFLFGLVSLKINLREKFEVCVFSRYRDIRGSQNWKSRSRDLGH